MTDSAAQPRALITGIGGQDGWYLAQLLLDRGYAVGPDDNRFLVVQELAAEDGVPGIIVVENWFAEFKNEP